MEKSSFPHVQEDALVVDKIEVKPTDAKTCSVGIGGKQEDGSDHDVTASISVTTKTHLDAHKDYIKVSKIKLSDLDCWKNGKVLVDMNRRTYPVSDDGIFDCNHNDVIGSTTLNDHVAGMVNDFVDGTFLDIEVDVPGKNSILKNDNDDT